MGIGAFCWAQAGTPGPDPAAVAGMALRRWCAGLTLSSPDPLPRPIGLSAWLAALAVLFAMALVAQGPGRAFGQFFDLPGQVRLWRDAIRRLRRASRFVVAMLGATVVGWTFLQLLTWNDAGRQAELSGLLLKSKTLGEVAAEQGSLAALTPLRDVLGLGGNLLLLVAAGAVVFRYSAERWGARGGGEPGTRWATMYWGAAWLYAIYRFVSLLVDNSGIPLGGCFPIEALAVPAAMAVGDGLLLAWALVELRGAELPEGEDLDVPATLALVPAATVATLLAMPAIYLAAGGSLLAPWIKSLPTFLGQAARPALVALVLGWGLVVLQAVAWPLVGLVGATAWTRGRPSRALRNYGRLLRAEGGRLTAVLALASLAGGGLSALAYALVLSLPAQPWVLAAADSYAHYATLPVGLATLAALVELGRRAVGPLPPPEKAPAPVEAATVAVAAASAEPIRFVD